MGRSAVVVGMGLLCSHATRDTTPYLKVFQKRRGAPKDPRDTSGGLRDDSGASSQDFVGTIFRNHYVSTWAVL